MNSAEVRECLLKRWPPSEYLSINEAPQDSMRQGRKLDVLVVSLWHSRGHELDGVEIKVSLSDWRRELAAAEKADWWWRHVHRFWIAAPVALAAQIRDEVPTGWGLLACSEDSSKALVKAEKHVPEPLGWQSCIGLMRASANAGVNALAREYNKGRAFGEKQGQARAESRSSDEVLRQRFDQLKERVEAFEAASGIAIQGRWVPDLARIGRYVPIIERALGDSERMARELEQMNGRLVKLGSQADEAAKAILSLGNRDAAEA